MSEATAQRMMTPDEYSEQLRAKLKDFEKEVRSLVFICKQTSEETLFDKWEVIANAMLTLRHVEDARMRLGKVIQYSIKENGGESCYKK